MPKFLNTLQGEGFLLILPLYLKNKMDTMDFLRRHQVTRDDKFMDDKVSRMDREVSRRMQSEGSRITGLLIGPGDMPQINAELF